MCEIWDVYGTHSVRGASEARDGKRTEARWKRDGGQREPNKATAHRDGGARGAGGRGAVGWRAFASTRTGVAPAMARTEKDAVDRGLATPR